MGAVCPIGSQPSIDLRLIPHFWTGLLLQFFLHQPILVGGWWPAMLETIAEACS